MSKVLMTGADSFTGRYLALTLQEAGHEVHGLVHQPITHSIAGVHAVHVADLADVKGLEDAVRTVQPQKVVHLAAISFVAHGDVAAIYNTNVVGTRNLLNALVEGKAPLQSVLLASSANIYGNAVGGVLSEQTPPAPANDYAVSKLAMEYVARLYSEQVPIVITRPFNYTGVGQADSFLVPKIISHVRKRAPLIELGNLDVERDFSDVRMVVQRYHKLLDTPSAVGGTFNVCSGVGRSLNEVLSMVKTISQHDFEVRVNPAFVRQNEVRTLIGDCSLLDSVVGAVAPIAFEDTLRWMLESTV